MHSPIDQRSVLIVEDDKFKLDSVQAHLRAVLGEGASVTVCEAMSTAAAVLGAREFDIVIIDMSIPSHPTAAGAGSPFSFPSGGLDVLFEIEELRQRSTCIVLTQYPEIEIEGVLVSIDLAGQDIFEKFGIRVADCIQYVEDGSDWKERITDCLRKQ